MNELKLPRLISNGMIIQQKKKVHIWGWDIKGRKIDIAFLGMKCSVFANSDGRFDAYLDSCEPGGPYVMTISDDAGNVINIEDILVGDVWMCSGQSNMELSMIRVKDKYPDEIANCDNDKIRTFKITVHSDFHGPLTEHMSGSWKSASKDTILQFSAVAYFFAKKMYSLTGVPFGFIDASLGGTRIESWMSAQMLEGYKSSLTLADKYADDDFVAEVLKTNEYQMMKWHSELDSADTGLKEHWEQEQLDEKDFKQIEIPCFFRDTDLKGVIGSIWFRRHFTVPDTMVGKPARVWLGTIVDSDRTFINGEEVGHIDYQYPPRKYDIPEGLLKKDNVIAIRVICERGEGRFTPGKKYAVFNQENEVDLSGEWKYCVAAKCDMVKDTDFVNWKPTGLYNGMTAPCHNYTIAGIAWYQGESNAGEPKEYYDLFTKFVSGYRKNWKDDKLPVLYVQLPNFEIDLHNSDNGETGTEWALFREYQRKSLAIPGTGMVVTIDTGEDNDLHPVNKRDIGDRLAYLALNQLYNGDEECFGPQIERIETEAGAGKTEISVYCSHINGGMYAYSEDKGDVIKDFEIMDADGIWRCATAAIDGDRIKLSFNGIQSEPLKLRYCFGNTNKGALIYNRSVFPMSPFVY